jgi:hypothetical protein
VRAPGSCIARAIVASGTTPCDANIHSAHRGVFANTSDLKPHAQAHYTSDDASNKYADAYRHTIVGRSACHSNDTAAGYTNEHANCNSKANGNACSVADYGSANRNTDRYSGWFCVTPW